MKEPLTLQQVINGIPAGKFSLVNASRRGKSRVNDVISRFIESTPTPIRLMGPSSTFLKLFGDKITNHPGYTEEDGIAYLRLNVVK